MVHEICTLVQEIVNKKAQQNEPLNLSFTTSIDNLSETEDQYLTKQPSKHIEQNAFENVRNAMLEDKRDYNINPNQNNESNSDNSVELNINSNNNSLIFQNEEGNNQKSFPGITNNYNMVYSRFKSDFTVISKLGQGGGGAVFKVQNHWDKMFYAIKRINTIDRTI